MLGGSLVGAGAALFASIWQAGVGLLVVGAAVMVYAVAGLRAARPEVWHTDQLVGSGDGAMRNFRKARGVAQDANKIAGDAEHPGRR
jgi:hypothetical protein